MSMWGSSRSLQAHFELGQDSEDLSAYFEVGRGSRDLPAKIATRFSSYRYLDGRFIVMCSEDLPSKLVVRHLNSSSVGLYAVADVVIPSVWGASRSLLGRFDAGQDSEGLYAILEIGQDSAELLARAVVRFSSYKDLIGRGTARQSASNELGSTTVIRSQAAIEIYGILLIGRSSFRSLVCRFFRGLESGRDLIGRGEIRQTGLPVNLSSAFKVRQDSAQLGARLNVTLPSSVDFRAILEIARASSTDFAANFEVKQFNSEGLYGRFEVGQGSRDLPGKFDVAWGYMDLAADSTIRNIASIDFPGKVSVTHSIALPSKAVIYHPASPGQLMAIFSIRLTNTFLDLQSTLELRRSTSSELVSRFVVIEAGVPVDLLGKSDIRQATSSELLGKGIIKNAGSVELSCNFMVQNFADLWVKFTVGPEKDSGAYIVCDDPADWINVVLGAGQGFIAMPWVEADTVIKKCGNSSARLTSTYVSGQYKEIRFGWLGTCVQGWDLRREVPVDNSVNLGGVFVARVRDSGDLHSEFEVGQGSIDLYTRFGVGAH